MKHVNQGYILFVVLLFLQIYSMLALFGLVTAKNVLRSVHQWQSKHILLACADSVLSALQEQVLSEQTTCKLDITPASQLANKSPIWWAQHACHGEVGAFRYYYVIEALGVDPCAFINNSFKEGFFAAVYYRITMRLQPKDENLTMMLQSTVVQAEDTSVQCQGKPHSVPLGRQMVRVLIGEGNDQAEFKG